MAKQTEIKIASTWKKVASVGVKVAGTWRNVKTVWRRIGGVWKEVYINAVDEIPLAPRVVWATYNINSMSINTTEFLGSDFTSRTTITRTGLHAPRGATWTGTHFIIAARIDSAAYNILRSADGITWTEVEYVADTDDISAIITNGLGVVYMMMYGAEPNLYTHYRKSTDNGATWGAKTLVTYTGGQSGYATNFVYDSINNTVLVNNVGGTNNLLFEFSFDTFTHLYTIPIASGGVHYPHQSWKYDGRVYGSRDADAVSWPVSPLAALSVEHSLTAFSNGANLASWSNDAELAICAKNIANRTDVLVTSDGSTYATRTVTHTNMGKSFRHCARKGYIALPTANTSDVTNYAYVSWNNGTSWSSMSTGLTGKLASYTLAIF